MAQPTHVIDRAMNRMREQILRLPLGARLSALVARGRALPQRTRRLLAVAGVALLLLVAINLGRAGLAGPTADGATAGLTISTADATLLAHARLPVTILATSSAASTRLTYTWNLGDGASATGAQVTHTYAASGYYVVSVTATDSTGRKRTAQVVLSVAPIAPKAILKATQDRAYSYMLTANGATSTGADLRYFWDYGDGQTEDAGNQRLVHHYYLAAGAYQVALTVVDSAGQRSRATAQIVVKPLKGA